VIKGQRARSTRGSLSSDRPLRRGASITEVCQRTLRVCCIWCRSSRLRTDRSWSGHWLGLSSYLFLDPVECPRQVKFKLTTPKIHQRGPPRGLDKRVPIEAAFRRPVQGRCCGGMEASHQRRKTSLPELPWPQTRLHRLRCRPAGGAAQLGGPMPQDQGSPSGRGRIRSLPLFARPMQTVNHLPDQRNARSPAPNLGTSGGRSTVLRAHLGVAQGG
jgi:hypothetical protein